LPLKLNFFLIFRGRGAIIPKIIGEKRKKYPSKPVPIIHTPIDRDADIVYNGDNNNFKV